LGFIWQDNIFENCRVVASYKYKKIAALNLSNNLLNEAWVKIPGLFYFIFNLMNGELEENEGGKKRKKALTFSL
jgi:hypothetical protein